ncbi:hypothetical protein [Spirosoma sp.]|uniref:hypothetical protein n=1 Tax=Spirosoma sp. TaxID=1899569 RepID=UPI003B3A1829
MKWTKRSLITLMPLLALNACQKHNEAVVTRSKTGETYELGTVLPELRTIQNDTARIALYPHARWFYLDMRMTGSQEYLALIQSAAKSGRQIKARIFKRPAGVYGEEIAQVYE